jgi:aspartate racemase
LKTIGVIGGMGPAAGFHFCSLLVELTESGRDQDHVPVLCYSNTQVPDRTKAILHNGPDPLPELVRSAQTLQAAGADFLVMPCNTAHHYYDAIVPHLEIPFLHMILEMIMAAKRQYGRVRRVGLLATSGTVAMELYHRPLRENGMEVLTPEAEVQDQAVMTAINEIKAGRRGRPAAELARVAYSLVERGAQWVIAGCTEIPLALQQSEVSVPLLDPMRLLAELALDRARQ